MIGWLRELVSRVRSSFWKRPLDQEFAAEMDAHLAMAVEENMQRGMSAEEARQNALIRFGGVEQAKEQHREVRGLAWFDVLLQDLRYTMRTLRRDRAFAVIAVLILALGIGANVAVFSVVNTILLRPLPFHDPQQLTWLVTNQGKGSLSDTTYTVAAFEELQRHNRSFQEVTGYQAFFNSLSWKLTGNGAPQPVAGLNVAGNFFQTLGVQPAIGRLFLPRECQTGGPAVALLSYPFWRRQFGGDPKIVGKSFSVNGEAVTVAGVLPDTFDFGSVFSPGRRVDIYLPAVMDFWRTWGNTFSLVGRLKPGVTVAQAQAESNVLMPHLKAAHPDWYEDYGTTVMDLGNHISGKLRRSLIVLWCAVGLIQLIVCVNLANLLLARAAARSKEFAMRSALGAGRGRIVRQLLTESSVLSGAGALLGLCIAFAITSYLAHQGSIALPLLSSIRIDGTALGWTVLITLSSAILFGLVPAFKTSGTNLQDTLKDSGQGMSQGRRHESLRAALVVSEVALACLLLVGAGLLLRSFLQVMDVDLGFEPSQAAALPIEYDDKGSPERRGAILREILTRVAALPGIESAGVADMLPLDRNRSWGLQAKGRTYRPRELQGILVSVITPGYLAAIGMRLHGGRDFNWHDQPKSEKVVIINQAAAQYHFPGIDPVGRLAVVNGHDARVVGVLSDARETSMEDAASPQMYLPATQESQEGPQLVVRSRLEESALQASVMRVLRSISPEQPLTEFRPLQELVDHAVSPRRFFVLLVMSFAGLGLMLASLGIYGVISYSVTRQRQEIAIRIALGATRARVQMGVLGKTIRLAMIGIAVGIGASSVAAHLIASLLFGTAPTDPVTFGWTILALGLVALVAGYVPARRAARTNPVDALRGN